jgi:hypothetical protein
MNTPPYPEYCNHLFESFKLADSDTKEFAVNWITRLCGDLTVISSTTSHSNEKKKDPTSLTSRPNRPYPFAENVN